MSIATCEINKIPFKLHLLLDYSYMPWRECYYALKEVYKISTFFKVRCQWNMKIHVSDGGMQTLM
jgi:hypothetical protein